METNKRDCSLCSALTKVCITISLLALLEHHNPSVEIPFYIYLCWSLSFDLYTGYVQRSPGQELFIPTTALLPPVKNTNADIAVHSIEIGTVVYITHQSYSPSLPAHLRGSILH